MTTDVGSGPAPRLPSPHPPDTEAIRGQAAITGGGARRLNMRAGADIGTVELLLCTQTIGAYFAEYKFLI